jgi:geranylgeranyl reductase family protein
MGIEHDVIVVGAGPAGATAATALAQKGCDVLLLDRHQFPRDKACGDAVPTGAIEILYRLGMEEKIKEAVNRGEFYPLQQMRLVSPNGHMLEATFTKGKEGGESYVAPRMFFDAVIQQHAVDSGAQFRQARVQEPIIENDRVVGVRARDNGDVKEFRSKVVIGADGVTSTIARRLRTKSERHVDGHRAVALRAYLDGIEEFPHQVEFYMYKGILPGYAWIFPTGKGQANIGLGMRLDYFRRTKKGLEDLLKQFLEMPAIRSRLKPDNKLHDIATWQLNFGSQKGLQHAFDGALLVGDAAGFINPLTGGGIHNALVSAQLAADTIINALSRGDYSRQNLKVYESLCHDALWGSMNRSYWLQKWLMRFPFLIDFLIRRMDANSLLAKTFLTKL